MIWLTWRQFRTQAYVTAAALAAVAVTLGVSGAALTHLYGTSGVPACGAASCGRLAAGFLQVVHDDQAYTAIYYLSIALLYVVPGVIGLFWGAPLITREFETGTFRMAWNQSTTRSRWLGVKLVMLSLATMATAGLISLGTYWWARPIYHAAGLAQTRDGSSGIARIAPLEFGASGVAPLGYAAFALLLGVTAGMLIRRTVPAMAVTLAIFTAAQLSFPLWLRPRLLAPLTSVKPLAVALLNGFRVNGQHMTLYPGAELPNAWILSDRVITATGRPFTGPRPQACGGNAFQQCQAALGRMHLRQVAVYQPASRYWELQWIETGICLALTLALAGLCFWWVRRRLT